VDSDYKTLGTILEEPLVINTNLSAKERKEKVLSMMAKVGLREEFYNRYPHTCRFSYADSVRHKGFETRFGFSDGAMLSFRDHSLRNFARCNTNPNRVSKPLCFTESA